ncbi:MAG TPA: hypothetical protein VK171_06610 [Fimbriimonas sp.]|nr:hypothetical protein [Fimbriimonas sp.]
MAPGASNEMPQKQPTKARGIDFKLVSIFAVPMALVWAGVEQVRPLTSIFDDADVLDTRLKRAEAAGFSFQEIDFKSKPVAPAHDAYLVIEKASKEKFFEYDQWKVINDFANLDSPTLDQTSAKQIAFAQAVAQRPKIDPRPDLYLTSPDTVVCPPRLKNAVSALTYDALRSARHKKPKEAVDALKLAFKVVAHFRAENDNYNTSHSYGAQNRLYSTIVRVAHELRGNKKYLDELEQLLKIDPVSPDLFAEMRLELFRICSAINDFQGYDQFTSSMIFVTGPDSCASEAELNPREDPFHRQPAEKPLFKQGLKSKAVAIYTEFNRILKSERSLREAGRKMDELELSQRGGLFGDYLDYLILEGREQYYALSQKPTIYQSLAKWGLEIASTYTGAYPLDLSPRKDNFLGGELRYRKVGKHFALYSTGLDGKDNGGPWLESGKTNSKRGDDFGLYVSEKPNTSSAPSVLPGRPNS